MSKNEAHQQLYNDAFRRIKKAQKLEKKREAELKKQQEETFVLQRSNRLAAERLIKEFEILSERFFAPNAEHKFNYLQMEEFLKMLNFLDQVDNVKSKNFARERTMLHDIWLILKGDEYDGVNERNLLLFLLAVMGFDFDIPPYVRRHTPSPKPRRNSSKDPSPGGKNQPKTQKPSPFAGFSRGRKESSNSTTNLKQRGGSAEGKDGLASERNKIKVQPVPSLGQFGKFDNDENIAFTSEEVAQIRKVYDLLHINRIAATKAADKSKGTVTFGDECGKTHEMSEQSKAYAESYRDKQLRDIGVFLIEAKVPLPKNGLITHPDLLMIQAAAQANEIKKKQNQVKEAELNQCTFKPAINRISPDKTARSQLSSREASPIRRQSHQNEPARSRSPVEDRSGQQQRSRSPLESLGSHRTDILYAMGKKYAERTDKSYIDWYDEKHREHCTFKPQLPAKRTIDRKRSLDNIKNADRSIERMRKAREQQEFIDWFKNERSPYDSLSKASGRYSSKRGVDRQSHKAGAEELTQKTQPTQKSESDTRVSIGMGRQNSDSRLVKNQTHTTEGGDTSRLPQSSAKEQVSQRSTTPSTNQLQNNSTTEGISRHL